MAGFTRRRLGHAVLGVASVSLSGCLFGNEGSENLAGDLLLENHHTSRHGFEVVSDTVGSKSERLSPGSSKQYDEFFDEEGTHEVTVRVDDELEADDMSVSVQTSAGEVSGEYLSVTVFEDGEIVTSVSNDYV